MDKVKPIQILIAGFLIGCAVIGTIWMGYTQHQANTEPDHSEYLKLIGGLKDDNARLEEKDKVKQDSLDLLLTQNKQKDSTLNAERSSNKKKAEKIYIYIDRLSNDSVHQLFLNLYQ